MTDFESTIQNLSTKVGNIDGANPGEFSHSQPSSLYFQPEQQSMVKSWLGRMYPSSSWELYIYAGVPVLVLILLWWFSPDFISYNDDNGDKKMSYYKLLLWTVGLSLLGFFGIFLYKYQHKF